MTTPRRVPSAPDPSPERMAREGSGMSELDLFGVEAPAPPKLTEAALLAMIDARYSPAPVNGYPARYLIGHHVQPPSSLWRTTKRIADALVLDRNATYPQVHVEGRSSTLSDYDAGYLPVHGFEVKVSRSDWLRELADADKAQAWKRYCHHWWLVAPRDVVKPGELPEGWGHLAPAGSRLRQVVPAPLLPAEPMPSPIVVAVVNACMKREARHA